MKHEEYINSAKAFVLELDDVLFPEKDYWLQVYYLFAQFIEYAEQIEAGGILTFMEESYHNEGHSGIFEKTVTEFNLPDKYRVNFDLLEKNARLPLKLLLYAPVLEFLKAVRLAEKPIFLLAEGDPAIQLNKIRQMEWNGLEQDLKVYFLAEMDNGYAEGLERICSEHNFIPDELLIIGKEKHGTDLASLTKLKFLIASKLL